MGAARRANNNVSTTLNRKYSQSASVCVPRITKQRPDRTSPRCKEKEAGYGKKKTNGIFKHGRRGYLLCMKRAPRARKGWEALLYHHNINLPCSSPFPPTQYTILSLLKLSPYPLCIYLLLFALSHITLHSITVILALLLIMLQNTIGTTLRLPPQDCSRLVPLFVLPRHTTQQTLPYFALLHAATLRCTNPLCLRAQPHQASYLPQSPFTLLITVQCTIPSSMPSPSLSLPPTLHHTSLFLFAFLPNLFARAVAFGTNETD